MHYHYPFHGIISLTASLFIMLSSPVVCHLLFFQHLVVSAKVLLFMVNYNQRLLGFDLLIVPASSPLQVGLDLLSLHLQLYSINNHIGFRRSIMSYKAERECETQVRSWGFKHVFTWTDSPCVMAFSFWLYADRMSSVEVHTIRPTNIKA